ncbi:uncharacterized protein [Miscanthus floridulus]|uniref:uncharacterized protein n=1 Tax=Miscanthus floridulus TaxID=154761 RepID=UPI0034598625
MDKFVRKESQVSTDNDDNDPRDGQMETENIVGVEEVLIDNTNIEMDNNAGNIGANSTSPIADVNDSFQPDIFDPRYWDSLDHNILKDNISRMTFKSVSATHWESRVESVKAIRFQCTDIREALLQVSDVDNDPKISSEAKGLANNELGEYEFILAKVIWYEVLYAINSVSKHLQAKDMLIDVAIEKVEGLISFFKDYRETGFLEASEIAKGIALEMDIGTTFRKRREIKRKRHFDENLDDTNADGKSDVDANELYVELKFLQDFIPKENMGPVEILKFLKRHDYFPNASIAYRVLLTIPVTVASAERSFSKLKLLKSYLRSTMTQQRLNDLATIALESGLLEKIGYEHIIEDFISRNTKRMKYFN